LAFAHLNLFSTINSNFEHLVKWKDDQGNWAISAFMPGWPRLPT